MKLTLSETEIADIMLADEIIALKNGEITPEHFLLRVKIVAPLAAKISHFSYKLRDNEFPSINSKRYGKSRADAWLVLDDEIK